MTAIFTLLVLAAYGTQLRAQDGAPPKAAFVDDWTHHHMVFSNPGASADAAKNGQLDHWQSVTNDPRYRLQQVKRNMGVRPVVDDWAKDRQRVRGWDDEKHHKKGGGSLTPSSDGIEKDWSQVLGGGYGLVATFAAPSNSNINNGSTSSLGLDGQTFTASAPTKASGTITVAAPYCFASGQGVTVNGVNLTTNATASKGTITFNSDPASYDTITVGSGAGSTNPGSVTYVWHTATHCGGVANCVYHGVSTAADASNLAAAIGGSCSGTACAANPYVTANYVSGTSVPVVSNCAGATALNLSNTSGGFPTPVISQTITVGTNGTATSGLNFALGTTNALTAAQIASAIGNNTGTDLVTASAPSNVITVTASTAGTTANSFGLALDGAPTGVTLSGTTLASGADGTTGANTFAYWSGNTYVSQSQLATNIATAVSTDNGTTKLVINAIPNEPTTGDITFLNLTTTNTYTLTETNYSGVSIPNAGAIRAGVQARVQPNAYPAKYGASLTTASCANDFVVYPTGQLGETNAATIVAYNNVYSSCTGTVPSVYWAYNTGVGYSVSTAPVFSWDGTQVAFIQSNATSSQLVLVKWAVPTNPTSFADPLSPTLLTLGSAYASCTPATNAPCVLTLPLAGSGNHIASISAPYYDYGSTGADALYVGDDEGYLHKYTGVFLGSPIEASTGWPVQLNSVPNKISSPVFDDPSGRVFVGDMGGVLYSVPSNGSLGTWYNTGSMGDAIADAPLIDSTNHNVFAFVTTRTAGPTCFGGSNVVYQFSTALTGYSSFGCVPAGTGGAGYYLYAGDFDNVYYTSGGTGNLYVVGNTGATTGANIYQVVLSGGNMTGAVNTQTAGDLLTTAGVHPWPSGVTEYCNGACTTTTTGCTGGGTCTAAGSTDYIFFSVYDPVNAKTGCTTGAGEGCILSFNVSQPNAIARAGTGQTLTTPAGAGCWATSGIVIDNDDAATTGASEIYFVNLNGAAAGGAGGATSAGCAASAGLTLDAIQAQQSNP
jgi:hypothetical protein